MRILCAAILAGSLASAGQDYNRLRVHQLKNLKTTKLVVNGHTLTCWLMDNESKRQEGLMFVTDKEMRSDQGMLFLFADEQVISKDPTKPDYSFWMHNTLIPLDIIYIDKQKKVINIGEGKPKNDAHVEAARTYFYTLELKAGTAKKLGIKPGTKLALSSSLSALD